MVSGWWFSGLGVGGTRVDGFNKNNLLKYFNSDEEKSSIRN